MIPPLFHRLNPRTLIPVPSTIICAVIISLLAGLLPINFLAEMTSIGTLVAFLIVSIGVMVLRQRAPDLPRGFRVPLYPILPIASIAGARHAFERLKSLFERQGIVNGAAADLHIPVPAAADAGWHDPEIDLRAVGI